MMAPTRGSRDRSRSRHSDDRFPRSQNPESRGQPASNRSRSPVSVSSYYEDDATAVHFQVIGTGQLPKQDMYRLRPWQTIGELHEQVATRHGLDPEQLQLYCQGIALYDTAVIRELPCYSAVARYPLRPDEASESRRFDEEARFMEDERHRALRDLRAWTTEDLVYWIRRDLLTMANYMVPRPVLIAHTPPENLLARIRTEQNGGIWPRGGAGHRHRSRTVDGESVDQAANAEMGTAEVPKGH